MATPDSEDEDYMSDAFLAKLNDSRPGLAWGKKATEYKKETKRKITDVKNRTKPKVVLEKEHREEGLNKTIGTENKGFSLLSKMGYKPGMALGKTGTGRKEPVPIQIKTGRGGLGQEAEKKRKQIEIECMRQAMAAKRKKTEKYNQSNYRASMQEKLSEKEMEWDLSKSQRACRQLDQEQGKEKPENTFYWPAVSPKQTRLIEKDDDLEEYQNEVNDLDSESDSDSATEPDPLPKIEEMLTSLTSYLRNNYRYCLWCGTTYTDEMDLKENCPGDTSDHHS